MEKNTRIIDSTATASTNLREFASKFMDDSRLRVSWCNGSAMLENAEKLLNIDLGIAQPIRRILFLHVLRGIHFSNNQFVEKFNLEEKHLILSRTTTVEGKWDSAMSIGTFYSKTSKWNRSVSQKGREKLHTVRQKQNTIKSVQLSNVRLRD